MTCNSDIVLSATTVQGLTYAHCPKKPSLSRPEQMQQYMTGVCFSDIWPRNQTYTVVTGLTMYGWGFSQISGTETRQYTVATAPTLIGLLV